MLRITFIVCLLFAKSAPGQASFPKDIACLGDVTNLLNKLGIVSKWFAYPDGVGGIVPNFGTVEIHQNKETTYLRAITLKSVSVFEWREPECKEKLLDTRKGIAGFSDLDLGKLLAENPAGGLIYIWSPHMSLSVTEVASLHGLKLKYPVTVILDPKADRELASAVAKANRLPASYLQSLDSVVLHNADITIHYPSVVFYKNGQILKRIPGYNGKNLIPLTQAVLK